MSNVKALNESLKKYVKIFLEEYSKYLDKEQLELLKSIDYDKIINIKNINYPLGVINFNQIYLSDSIDGLIKTMRGMPDYGKYLSKLNNKNYSSYLKYICLNGYNKIDYYNDLLFYLIFRLVVKNDSGLILGLINREVCYLGSKYNLRAVNLYKREEYIADKIVNIIGQEELRKTIFLSLSSSYKYLNDIKGFRYAELFYQTSLLIDQHFSFLKEKDYSGFDGIINYAKDYDGILYGDVYNYILDFSVKNNVVKM